MALSRFGASLLYQRLGRRPPKQGVVREPPPRVRLQEAEYTRRLLALLDAWDDHVETIGREATRSDAWREDASIEEKLREAYNVLVRASGLSDWLKRAGGQIVDSQKRYTERVTKLPPGNIARQAVIEEFRQENVKLVTRMSEKQIQEIADILRPAQAVGQRWEEIAPQIQERLGVVASRAKLIARDQTNKFNGTMQRLAQTGAGVEEYRWSTAGDFAVRGRPGGEYEDSKENHWALEGKIFRWASPPLIPGTSERAHPGQRIKCRCVAIPVIPLFEV